jgi:hypothetical protein
VSRLGPRDNGGTLLLGREALALAEQRLDNYLAQQRHASPVPSEAALQFEQARIQTLVTQGLDALEVANGKSELSATELAATEEIRAAMALQRFNASRLADAIRTWLARQ